MGGAKDESFIEERSEALADLCGAVVVDKVAVYKCAQNKSLYFIW